MSLPIEKWSNNEAQEKERLLLQELVLGMRKPKPIAVLREMVKVIVDHGYDINATADLSMVVEGKASRAADCVGGPEAASAAVMLLEAGANPAAFNAYSYSAVTHAIQKNLPGAARVYLEHIHALDDGG